MLLSNRVAIITGGSRGIGKGIALKFVEEGCSVVIADVLAAESKKTVEEIIKKGGQAIYAQCDVTNSAQLQAMVDQTISKFGKVDILVNNAGIGPDIKPFAEISEAELDKVLAVNVKGVFLCCKAVIPALKKNGYGKIINISSVSAIRAPGPINYTYDISKSGVLMLTFDLAVEFAPFNINVNAIMPGLIRTDMSDTLVPPGVNQDDFFREFGKGIPMGRVGTPADVAGVATFLASDLSAYVTGAGVFVAGGLPWIDLMKKPA
jgi:NAD(P)-dependent dehydrogenase (short-subunit alcohol dehydrogenase family)